MRLNCGRFLALVAVLLAVVFAPRAKAEDSPGVQATPSFMVTCECPACAPACDCPPCAPAPVPSEPCPELAPFSCEVADLTGDDAVGMPDYNECLQRYEDESDEAAVCHLVVNHYINRLCSEPAPE